jgi:hypothetical protein
MKRAVLVSCLSFLLAAVPSVVAAQAQATTGIIRGVVLDPAGNLVGGATVTVRETQTNFQRSLPTDPSGVFVAPLLPIGTYDVSARAVGYNEVRQTGIPLRVGATVDLRLQLAAITLQAVTVEAAPPVVDVTRIEAATRLPDAAASGLPNNGRDFLNLTLLTPNVAIVQGPDGDELTIAGQKGIHNNISVDGADFNNPFFGEQRGGQRPPFTFNLDAVQEIVVISDGANAEFGRSSGGFVNVITKSGTNQLHGSVHYFGKYDALSTEARHECESPGGLCASTGQVLTRNPDFSQHQFGFTLGGPIKRDKAFFFLAYDQQELNDTRQRDRLALIAPNLVAWTNTAFGGALQGEFAPIDRTDDARAFLAKFDFRLSDRHNASLKYNYTWSQQENGTFDVDTWGRSANGLEKDFSHAVNGSLSSFLSSRVTNEFRFQVSREDRPRPYLGPTMPGVPPPPGVVSRDGNRPFPDIAMGGGFRVGMPFFLPIEYYDSRIQVLDNVSIQAGRHLFKLGFEWNRVESVQTFLGFANGRFIFSSVDGFLRYAADGNGYVECPGDPPGGGNTTGGPAPCGVDGMGNPIAPVGPVLLYLQQAGVGGTTVEEAGTQDIPQHELAFFIQDTWKPRRNLTLNYGLRWEASIQPDVLTPPEQVFFSDFIGTSVTTTQGTFEFPSDGTIPSDWDNFQPRLGLAWDLNSDGRSVLRLSGGIYHARIPGLNLASTRSTNGSLGQTIFRNSAVGQPPNLDELLPDPTGFPVRPDVYVFDKDFENPRTISATVGYERELVPGLAGSISYTHARTDHLTRFFNSNDPVFGDNPAGCPPFSAGPWCTGLDPDGDGTADNGVNTLWTVKSDAKSRYNGVTLSLARLNDPSLQFQVNYTLSLDKSDDDNERDPFTLRYRDATQLDREYGWSDRDQRHRVNAWFLARLPFNFVLNNRVSYYSAQPVTLKCSGPLAGQRAFSLRDDPDRVCADGTVLKRNTGRKDNAFFSWDLRLTKVFPVPRTQRLEAIVEIFNLTNSDNFLDPTFGELLFNFDGTVQAGLGAPRQAQAGVRWAF